MGILWITSQRRGQSTLKAASFLNWHSYNEENRYKREKKFCKAVYKYTKDVKKTWRGTIKRSFVFAKTSVIIICKGWSKSTIPWVAAVLSRNFGTYDGV